MVPLKHTSKLLYIKDFHTALRLQGNHTKSVRDTLTNCINDDWEVSLKDLVQALAMTKGLEMQLWQICHWAGRSWDNNLHLASWICQPVMSSPSCVTQKNSQLTVANYIYSAYYQSASAWKYVMVGRDALFGKVNIGIACGDGYCSATIRLFSAIFDEKVGVWGTPVILAMH